MPALAAALLVAGLGIPAAGVTSAAAADKPAATAKGAKVKGKEDAGKGKGKGKGKGSDKVLIWLRVGKVTDDGVLVTVQIGQRLQDIAETYGVSIATLEKANPGIDSSNIMAGQKVLVPGATKVLAIKTLVPADKVDEVMGLDSGSADKDTGKDTGKDSGKDSGKGGGKAKGKDAEGPSAGWVMVKSGKITKAGIKHTVQNGQTLAIIGEAYGVSAAKIAKATGLGDPDSVKPGQKVLVPGATAVVAVKAKPDENGSTGGFTVKSGKVVKAGVMHTVQPGQTLAIIASAYGVKVSAILTANSLQSADSIKQGKAILIPGAKEVVAVKATQGKTLAMPTKITVQRIHTGETKTLALFDGKGKMSKTEYAKLEKLMSDTETGKKHKIHPRLCWLLKLVADHWPGSVISIYSGFRAYKPSQYTKKSKHNLGRAVDFTVEGVSNVALMKFLKTFDNVGVGYYPNSYFVHLDVRETSAFWVDYSGPGESPKYKAWKEDGAGKKGGKGGKKGDAGTDAGGKEGDVNVEADSDSADVSVEKK